MFSQFRSDYKVKKQGFSKPFRKTKSENVLIQNNYLNDTLNLLTTDTIYQKY